MTHDVRGMEKLKALLDSRDFIADVEHIREMDEFARITHGTRLLVKYGILAKHSNIIHEYIETGIFDESLVREPVRVEFVDTKLGTKGLALIISHDASATDVKGFIDQNWKNVIKPMLPGEGKQVRQEVPSLLRDEAIIESWINKAKTGKTNLGIALEHNVSVSQVNRIIARYKQSH